MIHKFYQQTDFSFATGGEAVGMSNFFTQWIGVAFFAVMFYKYLDNKRDKQYYGTISLIIFLQLVSGLIFLQLVHG
ncbi:MAG: hypothetical protein EOP48_25770 [Sphingobacteriales bacterium]|nr:MAG: hypothetical protein EOP48_25770 [Sphingobacteriales bacterium]